MLKTIVHPSPDLANFLDSLNLTLSQPQQRHVMQVADALITTQGNKTLSALYRHIVGDPVWFENQSTRRNEHCERFDHELVDKNAIRLSK